MPLPGTPMQFDRKELQLIRSLERLHTAFSSQDMIKCVEECLDEATNHMIRRAQSSSTYDA